MSVCRSCGVKVLWARTEHGRKMPLDAEPIVDARWEDGPTFVLRELQTDRLPLAISAWGLEGTEPHYRAHFDTCAGWMSAA